MNFHWTNILEHSSGTWCNCQFATSIMVKTKIVWCRVEQNAWAGHDRTIDQWLVLSRLRKQLWHRIFRYRYVKPSVRALTEFTLPINSNECSSGLLMQCHRILLHSACVVVECCEGSFVLNRTTKRSRPYSAYTCCFLLFLPLFVFVHIIVLLCIQYRSSME